jgi:hypothetical protein
MGRDANSNRACFPAETRDRAKKDAYRQVLFMGDATRSNTILTKRPHGLGIDQTPLHVDFRREQHSCSM